MNLIIAVKDEKVMGILEVFPGQLLQVIQGAMSTYIIQLQARVKEKLTDDVLHVRSGTLRRSINQQVLIESATTVRGIVGTNVRYAAVHEYGFVGTAYVPDHIRRITSSGRTASSFDRARMGKIGEKRLRYINGVANVRGHTMRMNLPERSFLRSSLKETAGDARKLISNSIKQAFQP